VKLIENLAREIHIKIAKRTREKEVRMRERIENGCINYIT
jgi:hypothetical protein